MSSTHSTDSQSLVAKLNDRLILLLPPLLCTQRSSWEQGILAQALLECQLFLEAEGASMPDAFKSSPYGLISWLYALAHDAFVRQAPDGRLAVLLNGAGTSDTGALDPGCIGPALYYLCSVERRHGTSRGANGPRLSRAFPAPRGSASSSMLDGVERMLLYLLEDCPRERLPQQFRCAYAEEGEHLLSHRIDAVEIWSDSVYMLPPFLASAAAFYAQHPDLSLTSTDREWKYTPRDLLRMALQQIVLAAAVLQSPTGEWSHIFDLHTGQFRRRAFWGVGNGWVFCGIVRVLSEATVPELDAEVDRSVPEDDPDSAQTPILTLLDRVYKILLNTVRACLAHMLPSHLFRDVLDDLASFEETNLAQMLSYTLYRLIDLHRYSPAFRAMDLTPLEDGELERWEGLAEVMGRAAEAKTDEWGFLRDVCGSPRFDAPGTAAEGQAWAIMMEVARAQYLSHKQTAT
ncbi:hypothetical protein GSI_13482 [Ganoderma sinense ZZ0214-1]|uniref:Uncharacterized protein n=1 Tax=Ganoderma sinense ZZ0214-1 TaxID=1077348 RepID=A0A2G8RQF1_9APHY|nr:hypothetical protein GSI_13482 [Ganoderma sinense ZZ0214-1]